MPELPEVETIRRSLEPHLLGRGIASVAVHHGHVTAPLSPRAFVAGLRLRRIQRMWRRGKYLVWDLAPPAGGAAEAAPPAPAAHLVVHLRMTGRLRYLPPRARWTEAPAHTHAEFRLVGGGRLLFHDVRKFGRLLLVAPSDLPGVLPPGRDPILDGLPAAALLGLLRGRGGTLKGLLLRQDLLCGLGNIYVDEALHRAGLHPARPGRSLSAGEAEALAAGISGVLEEALAFRGTTLLDYRTGDGDRGAFAAYLRVYGRSGRPCRACGTPVETLRLAGRTTAFCPRCQPAAGADPI